MRGSQPSARRPGARRPVVRRPGWPLRQRPRRQRRGRPPRLLPQQEASPGARENEVRKVNLEVLNRGSIQAITFPSAHVASTAAAALVLVRFMPLAGAVFLAIAVSIAVGAFLGRYHYFLDVVLGVVEATAVFLVCVWMFRL